MAEMIMASVWAGATLSGTASAVAVAIAWKPGTSRAAEATRHAKGARETRMMKTTPPSHQAAPTVETAGALRREEIGGPNTPEQVA
ncbi:hypothetical protein [Microlunatus sp. Y2014]|uniref:hypothetical protein n=1 Tax=Microlunatus sp. Y2014 TaxID=3418488 RepID=UPI003DA72313